MRIAFLVLVLQLFAPGGPAAAMPTDLSFSDEPLEKVLQTIAAIGKFNVIVEHEVARSCITLVVKQVEPLDALFMVSRMQALKVKRVRWEEGSTVLTYAIGRPEHIGRGFESSSSRVVQLRSARATEVAAFMVRALPDVAVKVDPDPRTNRLLLKGTAEVLEKVELLIRDVDLPVPALDVRLTVLAGPVNRPEPIWSGTATVAPGVPGRLHVAITGAASGAGWRIKQLSGKLAQRVDPGGLCTVSLAVDATLDKSGAGAEVSFQGDQPARDGEERVAGTVQVAPGEVVELRIRPEVLKLRAAPATPQPDHPAAAPAPGARGTGPSGGGDTPGRRD